MAVCGHVTVLLPEPDLFFCRTVLCSHEPLWSVPRVLTIWQQRDYKRMFSFVSLLSLVRIAVVDKADPPH